MISYSRFSHPWTLVPRFSLSRFPVSRFPRIRVVVSALASINVVNRHWAGLLLLLRGQVNRLGV